MNESTTVHRAVTVPVSQPEAFATFVDRFGDFKPAEHNLLAVPIAETVVEKRVGGYIVDRGVDGSECRWATIRAFEPPSRLVFSWNIGPSWQVEADQQKVSEVEVRFVAEGPTSTRVELEHRNLDRHGPGWESVRDGIGHDQGWPLYLQRYEHVVADVHRPGV